jgi:hypothetical protein
VVAEGYREAVECAERQPAAIVIVIVIVIADVEPGAGAETAAVENASGLVPSSHDAARSRLSIAQVHRSGSRVQNAA